MSYFCNCPECSETECRVYANEIRMGVKMEILQIYW